MNSSFDQHVIFFPFTDGSCNQFLKQLDPFISADLDKPKLANTPKTYEKSIISSRWSPGLPEQSCEWFAYVKIKNRIEILEY